MNGVRRMALAILGTGCALSASSADAAFLTGSVDTSPPSPANLTAEGPLDWVIWADTSTATSATKSPVEQKSGGAGVFSVLSPATPGTLRGGVTSSQGFSWSDGTTNASTSNRTDMGLIFDSTLDVLGEGVQLTVTGSTATERQVKIWGSGTNGSGTFTASLNGAANVVLQSQAYGGKTPTLFTVNFQPDSPGDLLTIKYVLATDTGSNAHVGLQAAAIANVPEPAAGVALLAAGGLLMRRRRRWTSSPAMA